MKKWLMSMLASLMLSTSALAAIDLNTATQSELETIKGIGPAKAKDIVEYRQKNGAFKNLAALAAVKGFGKASIAKFKNELVVGVDTKTAAKKQTQVYLIDTLTWVSIFHFVGAEPSWCNQCSASKIDAINLWRSPCNFCSAKPCFLSRW